MSDTEDSTCDFCGDPARVAVSEQGPSGKVRICRSCIAWASEQLDAKPNTPDLPGPGAPTRCTDHGGIGFKSDCIVCPQVGGADTAQSVESAAPSTSEPSTCPLEAVVRAEPGSVVVEWVAASDSQGRQVLALHVKLSALRHVASAFRELAELADHMALQHEAMDQIFGGEKDARE